MSLAHNRWEPLLNLGAVCRCQVKFHPFGFGGWSMRWGFTQPKWQSPVVNRVPFKASGITGYTLVNRSFATSRSMGMTTLIHDWNTFKDKDQNGIIVDLFQLVVPIYIYFLHSVWVNESSQPKASWSNNTWLITSCHLHNVKTQDWKWHKWHYVIPWWEDHEPNHQNVEDHYVFLFFQLKRSTHNPVLEELLSCQIQNFSAQMFQKNANTWNIWGWVRTY